MYNVHVVDSLWLRYTYIRMYIATNVVCVVMYKATDVVNVVNSPSLCYTYVCICTATDVVHVADSFYTYIRMYIATDVLCAVDSPSVCC